ncbi:hypothetical protein [Pseudoxanthomonas sp. 10H]|uniref:hypothetical protein n=1 Tax=Pseudoxanthomonas sp. 10H TaxID=3242729 RepID=UPI0035570F2B
MLALILLPFAFSLAEAAESNKSPSLRELQQITDRSVRYVDRQLEANKRRAAEIEAAQSEERMVDHAESGAEAMEAAAENLGNAASPNPLSKTKAGLGGGQAVAAISEQKAIEQNFMESVVDGKAELQRLSDERRELIKLRNKLAEVQSSIVQARRNLAAKQKAAKEQAEREMLASQQASSQPQSQATSKSKSTGGEPRGRAGDRAGDIRSGGVGPRNDGPKNDGPKNDGPKNDGPKDRGPDIRLN